MSERRIPRLLAATASATIWIKAAIGAQLWLRACDRVGSRARSFGRPHIENRGKIFIGDRVRLSSAFAPLELVTGPNGVIDIADGVFINYGTLISAARRVRIGANVMIGNFGIIADTDVPGAADVAELPPPGEVRDVEIGDGAWLGARVTVLPGSQIGAGAIVAAGSVVSGTVPPGAIVGGIPARILRGAGGSRAAADAAVKAGAGR